jgi:transposase
MAWWSRCCGRTPLSGDWFVFFNKRRERIKVLAWEGDGLSIWYKRLEAGTYAIPQHDGEALQLTSAQLALMLSGIDLRQTRSRKRYQRPG